MTARTGVFFGAVVVVSLLSAAIGALVGRQSIDAYVAQLSSIPRVIEGVTSARPLTVPGTYTEAVARVEREGRAGVLALVATDDAAHASGVRADSARANALVMTSDGWVLTTNAVRVGRFGVVTEKRVAVVDRVVAIPQSDLAFAHVEATFGQVLTFGASQEMLAGSLVFVMDQDALAPRALASVRPVGLAVAVESSDVLWRQYALDALVDMRPGAAVFDAAGALVGVMETETLWRPLHMMTPFLAGAFEDGEVAMPRFGVSYVDRARVLDEDIRDGLEVVRVERGGAAYVAGVHVGDVVTHVNGHDANDLPFAERVLLDRGRTLTLTIERGGAQREIVVE